MGKVFIEDLELYTLIGVHDFERVEKQRVIVSLEMECNLTKASRSDDVADTLDYGVISEKLAQLADTCSYKLLEALAADMMSVVFDLFEPKDLSLTVEKPDIIPNAKSVGITMKQTLKQYLASKK